MENSLLKIGSMWINQSKNGEKYMSGNLNNYTQILMFKNKNKQKETDPDYFLYFGAKKQQEKTSKEPENPFANKKDNDIPF